MFIGFFLPKNASLAFFAEKILNYLIFLILIIIGIELASVENLISRFNEIFIYWLTLVLLTVGSGLLSLYIFDKISPCPYYQSQNNTQKNTINIHGSLIQLGCLIIGFWVGLFLPPKFIPHSTANTALLMALLFLVGFLLKNSNITLKQALFNKRGLQISIVFMLSVMASGLVFSMLFTDVSWQKGLALASGFGWYSLSGTIMTQSYGAIWGSVALLNDLTREILALLFIPYIMKHSSSSAIGLAGVTGMDFTLPILQKSGGTNMVPLIISFGFITNILSPIFMVFFSTWK